MPRLAANLGFLFPEYPLVERFGAAARAGFSAVETTFPYESPAPVLRAEIERHGLTMLGINTALAPNDIVGFAALPGHERQFDITFQNALDYQIALGGRAIHCMASVITPGEHALAQKTFIGNLARAADLAAPHGITILIEPINQRDRPGYFLSRAEHAADIIAAVDRKNLKLQFDFYHQQIEGGDLIRRFAAHLPLIGHVQIASVPERHEPDSGEVNFAEILAAIDASGYAGYVAAEYKPRGRTEDGLGWARPYGIVPR